MRFNAPDTSTRVIGVAPLVDIVLLLICFYLIVSKVAADQDDPSVELPVVTASLPEAEPTPPLVLNLRADGTVTASDAVIDAAAQRALLRAGAARGDAPALVIRADARAAYGDLAALQKRATDAGFRTLTLRTQPPE